MCTSLFEKTVPVTLILCFSDPYMKVHVEQWQRNVFQILKQLCVNTLNSYKNINWERAWSLDLSKIFSKAKLYKNVDYLVSFSAWSKKVNNMFWQSTLRYFTPFPVARHSSLLYGKWRVNRDSNPIPWRFC